MQSEGNAALWNDIPTVLAAAHELKSPLVLIRQLALQLEKSEESIQAARIRMTAERSLQLVESLTRVARLEDALFECEPINLSELHEDVVHELTPLTLALGQKIQPVASKRHVVVVGNRSLLRSVLLGLCDNALTHNNPQYPIELRISRRGDRVLSSIRDFGPVTSSLTTIRRSVGRTPQPIASRPRSSGLGLLIAEQFARHMDATLTLRRHHTAGVTLALELPASKQLSLLAI